MGDLTIKDYKINVLKTPWRNITYLTLETEDGTTGVGEARVVGRTHTVIELLKDIKRHFIGHSARDTEALYKRITLDDFSRPGPTEITAFSMLEMACLDILGKKAGVPVYDLFGGKVRDKIPAYANGWYTVEREPKEFQEAAKKVAAMGYKGLKLDPFGNGDLELSREQYEKSIDIIKAVHDVLPSYVQMFIEMHGRFALYQAIKIAKAIEDLNIGWIEEPCRSPDLRGHLAVKEKTTIPVATGERLYTLDEYMRLFELGAADIIQVDLTNFGFRNAKTVAAIAENYGMTVAPHNVGGAVSTLAGIHLMATLRNGKILEHFNDFADAWVKGAVKGGYPEVVNGCFSIPDKPGWGVELDYNFIAKHPPEIVDGVIQDPGLNLYNDPDWHRRGQGND